MPTTEKMTSLVGNLTKSLGDLQRELKGAARIQSEYAGIADRNRIALMGVGHSMNIFDRAVKDNLRTMRESERALVRYEYATKQIEIRQAAARLMTQHWTKSVDMLGNAMHNATKNIVSGVNAMANWLSTSTSQLGSLRRELLDFNRAELEATRSASMMGREKAFNADFWRRLSSETAISKKQFMDIQNTMFHLSQTMPLIGNELTNFSVILAERFGPGVKRIQELQQRFTDMENAMPGIRGELMKMAESGERGLIRTDKMADLTLLMSQLGTNIRDLDIMNQIAKPMTQAEVALTKFENAVMEREQALQDMNINTARSAEDAMIKMERIMTKITRQIDKLLQKFDMLPKAFVYVKAIAGVAFGMLITKTMTLTRYVEQLAASFAKAGAMSRTVQVPGLGGMGGMMMGAAAVLPAAYMAYQGYRGSRGAAALPAGAGVHERYAAEAGRTRGYGTMIGAGAGLLLGGALGSVIPGGGTVIGAGLGSMAGGALGGWIGGRMGPSEDQMRSLAKVDDALRKRGMKTKEMLRTEEDILRVINEQETREDRAVAIRAIIEDGARSEEELRNLAVKHGQKEVTQLIDMRRKHQEILNDQKEARETAMQKVRALNAQLAVLKVVEATFGRISQHSSTIGETLVDTWARGFATAQFERASQYSGMMLDQLRQSSDVVKELYATNIREEGLAKAAAGPGAFLAGKGVGKADVQAISGEFEKVLRAKEQLDAVPIFKKEERDAAQANLTKAKDTFSARINELKIDKDIKGQLKKIVEHSESQYDNLRKAAPILAKIAIDEKIIAEAKKLQELSMRGVTAEGDTTLNIIDAQLRVQRLQASVAEKTAAGYAVSYAHQKQIYDTLVNQRSIQTYNLRELERTAPGRLWRDHEAALSDAGVNMKDLGNLGANYNSILKKINDAKAKEGANEESLAAAASAVGTELKGQIQRHEKILSLQEQELEMAMNLREGYLDVINEMTTSSDMMAQMIPDAQRGIMAMQELSMRAKGQEFGGALQRGFVSFRPFAEAQDIAGAPRFTRAGFVPPSRSAVVAAYQRQVERMLNANARTGGPGFFAGQAPLERSPAFQAGLPGGGGVGPAQRLTTTKTDLHSASVVMGGTTTIRAGLIHLYGTLPGAPSAAGGPGARVGAPALPPQRAAGGLIPGAPSDRDNLIGTVDGRQPIGLASGEYVVNARSTRKFLPLLEALNASGGAESSVWGLQGGGRAMPGIANDMWASYMRMPEDELVKRSRHDPRALSALAIRIRNERGDVLSYSDAMRMAKFRSRGALSNFGLAAIYGIGRAGSEAGASIKRAGLTAASVIPMALSGAQEVLMPTISVSKVISPMSARVDADVRRRSVAGMKNIQREMVVRPGLAAFIQQKTGGKKSRGAWIDAYDEFMAGPGARQDARIANEAEVTAYVRSSKTGKMEALAGYMDSIQAGASGRDAKRAALLAATAGPGFSGWKKARMRSEEFWMSPAERKIRDERVAEQNKRERERLEKLAGIRGAAGGGLIAAGGLASLAAMMSGTVNIGSLNVNGEAIARNLRGANDMSIAMEQARQNHYT